MNVDVETIQELCRTYKPSCELALRKRGFFEANPLRAKGVCGLVTNDLGKGLVRNYAVIEQAIMNEKITDDNKHITVWRTGHPGFFYGHTFLVISDIVVDGAFHQYMDAFNLSHEELNDVLVVPHFRLDEKVDQMIASSSGKLPQGVRNLEHLRKGLRSIWDYKVPPSYTREFDARGDEEDEY